VGCAFILLKDPACVSAPTGDEIMAFAKQHLAGYKVPRRVVFLAEFPRLGSGKPDRRALSSQAPPAEVEKATL
jgi:acyl-CoA synthetase (AMP-forming)/AMP-acid ligase II